MNATTAVPRAYSSMYQCCVIQQIRYPVLYCIHPVPANFAGLSQPLARAGSRQRFGAMVLLAMYDCPQETRSGTIMTWVLPCVYLLVDRSASSCPLLLLYRPVDWVNIDLANRVDLMTANNMENYKAGHEPGPLNGWVAKTLMVVLWH